MAAATFNAGRGGMGSIQMDVDVRPPVAILVKDFNALGTSIRSLREPLERAVRMIVAPSLPENFDAQGRPVQWEEVSGTTILRREQLGIEPFMALIRKGTLQRAAGQLNIWKYDGTVGNASAYIGELPQRAWYGMAHQYGYTGGYGAVTPARPWAVIQPEDEFQIEYIFEDWLEERLARHGFGALA